jgi:Holliday junction resolvase
MRRASKIDDNQKEIVDRFRKLGWSVLILSSVGKGCPDILCGKFGRCYLVEIKDGKKSPSARKLTDDQIEFHKNWNGSLIVVKSIDEVIEFNRKHSR